MHTEKVDFIPGFTTELYSRILLGHLKVLERDLYT